MNITNLDTFAGAIKPPPKQTKRGELIAELKQLQRAHHDLDEQMIIGAIDPIIFHYSTQANEVRQREIFNELEELTATETEDNKINQYQIEDENYKQPNN